MHVSGDAGFFSSITSTATIQNVGLQVHSIRSSRGSYTGGLVGRANGATFTNVYTIVSEDLVSLTYVGGLAGEAQNINLMNSYTIINGDILGAGLVVGSVGGGIAGDAQNATFANSYTILNGNIITTGLNSISGGIVGVGANITFTNVYSTILGNFTATGTTGVCSGNGNNNCNYHLGSSGPSTTGASMFTYTNGYFKNQNNEPLATWWDFENTWEIDASMNNGYPILRH